LSLVNANAGPIRIDKPPDHAVGRILPQINVSNGGTRDNPAIRQLDFEPGADLVPLPVGYYKADFLELPALSDGNLTPV